jgi:hypothetical protein
MSHSDGFRTDLDSAMLCLEPDCSTVFDRATSRACRSRIFARRSCSFSRSMSPMLALLILENEPVHEKSY